MYSAFLRIAAGLMVAGTALAQTGTLRVCADPNNMPFSNEAGQGFENKLAELVAAGLSQKLEYLWLSERKSFASKSLNAGVCDVVMGVPASLGDVLASRPYYRSSYVFVTRRDRNLQISSLLDPRLADLRIGMHVVGDDLAPPSIVLARRGITRNITGYSLFGNYGEPNPPRKLIDAVENGEVDVAIAWGPFAGYFAEDEKYPLSIAPVTPPALFGIPFSYDISAAVRAGNGELKTRIDRVLDTQAASIQQILNRYAVPQVP